MDAPPAIVEFFGMARQRANRAELAVPAGRLRHVLAAVERACPALTGLCQPDGSIVPHYRISRNGERFLCDLDEEIAPGERILILSADVGG